MNNKKILSPIKRAPTISNEIEQRIVLSIASGELSPGERLTETKIAEITNVSRVPAREALLNLASKGILVSAEVRGLKIIDFTPEQIRDVQEVRLGLEEIGFRNAIKKINKENGNFKKIDAVLSKMNTLSKRGDVIALGLCDIQFHREIMAMSDNQLLIKIWEDLTPHLLIVFCKDWHSNQNRIAEVQLHTSLRDFLKEGNVSDLHKVLRHHFSPD